MDVQLVGHAKIWDYLTTAAADGRLPHALLFTGPKHVGKAYVAQLFSHFWLCSPQASGSSLFGNSQDTDKRPCTHCPSCQSFNRGVHPDMLSLSLQEGEHQISVKAMRTFLSSLSQSPSLGAAKIGIVDGVEYLTTTAANAFLKTLEEPSASTHLILISHDPQRLLPTILSRCQQLEFTRVFDVDPMIARDQRWIASDGRPGLYFSHPQQESNRRDAFEQWKSFFVLTAGQRIAAIDGYFVKSKKGKHADQKQDWRDRLMFWQQASREMLLASSDMTHVRIIDALEQIRKDIDRNINIRAHIEYLLLRLPSGPDRRT